MRQSDKFEENKKKIEDRFVNRRERESRKKENAKDEKIYTNQIFF